MPRAATIQPQHPCELVNVVARNIRACMAWREEFNAPKKLAKATGLGHGTIQRARNGEVALAIDSLAAIAAAFDLEPWHLLIDGLDPSNPPMLAHVAEAQLQLLERIKSLSRSLTK